MRCRRVGYRYAVVIQSNPLGEEWGTSQIRVKMASHYWTPAADVYETNKEIFISLEIAGVDPDQLEILLFEDALIVRGQRNFKPTSSKGLYHLTEIRQGPFCFELPLNESFSPEQVQTEYENGLLSIILKKQVE